MLNHTALTLIFLLIVVVTLGSWGLSFLLLQARRDATVEELVAAHAHARVSRVHVAGADSTGSAGAEETLIQQIRRVDIDTRERHVLAGALAALILLGASIGYVAIRTFASFLGM